MAMPLWLLVVERRPSHAERMLYKLLQARFGVDRQGFGTRERYRAKSRADLGVVPPDSPWLELSVREAFEQLEERDLDAPILVVAKTIGEEIAVASLRQGVEAHLLKAPRRRLGPPAEHALRASRLRERRRAARSTTYAPTPQWQATLDAVADPIFLLDARGIVLRCNQAAVTLMGRLRADIIGRRSCTLLHTTSRHREARPYLRALKSLEKESLVQQIEDRWFEISVDPILDGDGCVIGFVQVLEEMRAGRLAEEATEQATPGLTLLSEIGSRITRVLSLQSALESVVGMIQRRLGYHSVAVLRLDREGTSLVMKATAGRLSGVINEQIQIDIRNGLMGWAARHGETVLVNDVDADPRYINSYPERIFSQSELSVPIQVGNDVVGILDVQSDHRNAFNQNDVLVMEASANQIAVAMENARLHAAQRAAREQLRELTTYLEDAREEERTRIAREIHDELGRAMTALKLDVSWLIRRLPAGRPGLVQRADAISHTIDETVQIIRRISSELRPGILDDLGLAAAIEWEAETFTERSDIPCELDLDSPGDSLDRRVTTVLFRIFQEALTNVVRHAAASRVCVRLKVTREEATLTVQDDGRGISQSDLGDGRSLGLIGMRERARTLGGQVSFRGRSAEGTTVTACIPRAGPESREP
ncbi:MAG: GAF domain-containing protein [Anaerolineae bacterium]